MNKLKILNDPIYGFINIPSELIYDLMEHPYFQRLRRISQMGLSYLVYPGAHHTRFHHALGCMFLMQKAVSVLRFKGVHISEAEENALYVAILLHDIGHGPFSHAMEHSIVETVSHEQISLLFMQKLNKEFEGKLSLAIQIFKGEYPRKFMLQLISSQLDMDRLDYLKRDSFYSGVEEGKINSDRLTQMMTVVDDQLVIEEKGIYSVEKFLMARRLMYWQVYFHKTSLVAEQMLTKALKRAKELSQKKQLAAASAPLQFFMMNKIDDNNFDDATLNLFAQLDDYDIISALKEWQHHPDFVLSELSKMIVNRDLLKISISKKRITKTERKLLFIDFMKDKNLTQKEASYFIFDGKIENKAYDNDKEQIFILKKNKTILGIVQASDQLNLKALSRTVTKYYACYPKSLLKN